MFIVGPIQPEFLNGFIIQPINLSKVYVYSREDTCRPNGRYFQCYQDALQYVLDETGSD